MSVGQGTPVADGDPEVPQNKLEEQAKRTRLKLVVAQALMAGAKGKERSKLESEIVTLRGELSRVHVELAQEIERTRTSAEKRADAVAAFQRLGYTDTESAAAVLGQQVDWRAPQMRESTARAGEALKKRGLSEFEAHALIAQVRAHCRAPKNISRVNNGRGRRQQPRASARRRSSSRSGARSPSGSSSDGESEPADSGRRQKSLAEKYRALSHRFFALAGVPR